MNRKLKPKKNVLKLFDETPLTANELKTDVFLEKLPTYSNKKLLVTAIALRKKSKREKRPEVAEAMLTLSKYIAQIVKGRAEAEKLQEG